MSAGPFRLALAPAAQLAAKIAADLAPVCERVEVAGSVRRGCELVDRLDLVAIPKFSRSLLPDVPGVSLLDMHLVALCGQGRFMRASAAPVDQLTEKEFYVGSMLKQGVWFSVTITATDAAAWPVVLAIKTGPAEFAEKLRTFHRSGGYLPGHWAMRDGWRVYAGEQPVTFEDEKDFIEQICGQWIEPEKR